MKIHGWGSGAVLYQPGAEKLCCEHCRLEELVAWSGVWLTWRTSRGVIGLSVSPWDDAYIIAAVTASQNTSYARVVAWMRRLYPLLDSARLSALEERARLLNSYQVRRSALVARLYAEARLRYTRANLWERRARLLELPGVGVKTAHAHILFTTYAAFPVPIDRHVARRLGARIPSDRPCRSATPCPKCPLRHRCPVWMLYQRYGAATGIVQTAWWLEAQGEASLRRLLAAASTPPGS